VLFVCVYLQVGMRHFHLARNKYHCPIVNLDKVWALVGEEVRRGGVTAGVVTLKRSGLGSAVALAWHDPAAHGLYVASSARATEPWSDLHDACVEVLPCSTAMFAASYASEAGCTAMGAAVLWCTLHVS
jgi:hypothetical protein